MHCLIRRGEFLTPLKICLDKDEVLVGRYNFTELQISNAVSRNHASFRNHKGKWYVIDLKSTNGIYVNGNKIQPSELTPLKIGDRIGLGTESGTSDNLFEFELCQDQEIITLSDSDDSDKAISNEIVISVQKLNDSRNDFTGDELPIKTESISNKYASVLCGKQVIIPLTRCDSEITKCGKKKKTKQPKKRRRVQLLDSSSEEEEECNITVSEKSLDFAKRTNASSANEKSSKTKLHSNVYSSESTDEDSSNPEPVNNVKLNNKRKKITNTLRNEKQSIISQDKVSKAMPNEIPESSSVRRRNLSGNKMSANMVTKLFCSELSSGNRNTVTKVSACEVHQSSKSISNVNNKQKTKLFCSDLSTEKKITNLEPQILHKDVNHINSSSKNNLEIDKPLCRKPLQSATIHHESLSNSNYKQSNSQLYNKNNCSSDPESNISGFQPSNNYNNKSTYNAKQPISSELSSNVKSSGNSSSNFSIFKPVNLAQHVKTEKPNVFSNRPHVFVSESSSTTPDYTNQKTFTTKSVSDIPTTNINNVKDEFLPITCNEPNFQDSHRNLLMPKNCIPNTNISKVKSPNNDSSRIISDLKLHPLNDLKILQTNSSFQQTSTMASVNKIENFPCEQFQSKNIDLANIKSEKNFSVAYNQPSYTKTNPALSNSTNVSFEISSNPLAKNNLPIKYEITDQHQEPVCGAVKIEHQEENQCHDLLPSSLRTIVKAEPESLSVVESKTKEISDDEENFGYSQVDEVITISDDEDYLNFSSSQDKHNLNIKVEPLECDDIDFEYHEKVENEENNILLRKDQNRNHQTRSSLLESIESEQNVEDDSQSGSEMSYSENIDAIEAFIKKTTVMPTSSNAGIKSSISNENSYKDINSESNDFFPILSQNFYTQNEALSDDSCHSPKEKDSDAHESKKHETQFAKSLRRKPTTVTLLTEAKPMQFRARYQRGKEEWFQDRYDKNNDVPSVKLQKKIAETEKKVKIPKESKAKAKLEQKKSKTNSLKKKVQKEMGNRIRIPNGGSAIRLGADATLNKTLPSKKNSSNKVVEKKPVSSSYTIKSKDKKKENNKAESSPKKQPSRFASRSEFLTKNSTEIEQKRNHLFEFKIPKIVPSKKKSPSPSKISKNLNKPLAAVVPSSAIVKSACNSSEFYKKVHNPDSKLLCNEPEVSSHNTKHSNNGVWLKLSDQQPFSKNISLNEKCPKSHQSTSLNQNLQNKTWSNFSKKNTSEKMEVLDSKKVKSSNEEKRTSEIKTRDPRLRDCSKRSVSEQISPLPSTSKNSSHITEDRICIVSPNIQQPSSSNTKHLLEKSIRLDFDSVLSNILHWNPSWLKEYKTKMKTPPPSILEGIKCLPLSFSSVNHYIRSFFPFILLELWEYIHKEYNDILHAGKGRMEINAICIMVTESVSKGDILVLHCETLISPESLFYPREGNIIIVEVYEDSIKSITKLFGYIFYVNRQPAKSTHLHHLWKQRPESKSSNSLLYKFSIKMKKVKFPIALEKLTKAFILCYVANKIRLADGLQFLCVSELQHFILQPSMKCLIKDVNIKAVLPATINEKYNASQTSVINGITEEMKTSCFTPKLLLLQGPPGTGKTHTIMGIIQNLLSNIRNIKILITAPSNAAVDVLGRRLIAIKRKSKGIDMKIVRVGVYSQIHKDMLPYTLEDLTRMYSSKTDKEELDKLKMDLTKKTNVILDLEKQINLKSKSPSLMDFVYGAKNKLMMEKRRKDVILGEIERIKKKITNPNDPAIYSDKLLVLEKANIIITTLGSCRLKILEKVFAGKSKTRFNCCIVDEAAQCTEPELLQILAFGVTKLILVGDHRQLPATVYSQTASTNKYDVSLFERIHMYFSEKNLPSPIFMLKEQHRMHSEICSFPSVQFYSNKLCTPSYLNRSYSRFPLKPFIVLNVNDSQESDIQSSKKNFFEAEIISEICKQMLHQNDFPNYSVGVITPYQGQKDLVIRKFKDKRVSYPVTVDTVDRFQGSEKDLIILSCVRARSQNGGIGFMECEKRLNVAITRAKQCLIICGHMTSLEKDPVWKALIAHSKRLNHYITVTAVEDIPFLIKDEFKRVV